jgi:hypothetical protein
MKSSDIQQSCGGDSRGSNFSQELTIFVLLEEHAEAQLLAGGLKTVVVECWILQDIQGCDPEARS